MRGCRQIDFAHCGDREISFPALVHRLYRHESMAGLRGVMWREGGVVQYAGGLPTLQI